MINVGIIGCGFVGGALKDWLEHNSSLAPQPRGTTKILATRTFI